MRKTIIGIKIAHIDNICKKSGQSLNALSSVAPYMDFSKRHILVSAFSSLILVIVISTDVH